jgi:hypothetical protein
MGNPPFWWRKPSPATTRIPRAISDQGSAQSTSSTNIVALGTCVRAPTRLDQPGGKKPVLTRGEGFLRSSRYAFLMTTTRILAAITALQRLKKHVVAHTFPPPASPVETFRRDPCRSAWSGQFAILRFTLLGSRQRQTSTTGRAAVRQSGKTSPLIIPDQISPGFDVLEHFPHRRRPLRRRLTKGILSN